LKTTETTDGWSLQTYMKWDESGVCSCWEREYS